MVQNCWEAKNCGREVGGKKTSELGVCPAASDRRFQNMNHGKVGGRICWAVAGTLCGGAVQGSEAAKRLTCMSCTFYGQVKTEEGASFRMRP